MTPAMEQYMKIKAEYPDHIVLFRMGDFYETFYDDAKKASSILGIALTARDKEKKIPMAGVPCHALDSYLMRLIDAKQKVVLVEQLEDPKQSVGIVKRGVTRIFTPGTVFESESKKANYLCSICKNENFIEFSFADITEGIISLAKFDSIGELLKILAINQAKELIYSEQLFPEDDLNVLTSQLKSTLFTPLDSTYFFEDRYSGFITKSLADELAQYQSASITAILNYFYETQRTELGHINHIIIYNLKEFMNLDVNVISSLEIFEGQKKDAVPLIKVIDNTVTHGGARTLRKWLSAPLIDLNQIKHRQSIVAAIKSLGKNVILSHQSKLAAIHDLNRIATKIGLGSANARDLRNLVDTIGTIFEFISDLRAHQGIEALNPSISDIEKEIENSGYVLSKIHNTIVDGPPLSLREGNMIKPQVSAELDELRDLRNGSQEWLDQYERQQVNITRIPTLKVRYNKVFGFYIEVSKAQSKNVPKEYIRKQTLVNAERFITLELKEYEAKFLAAEDRIKQLEYQIFCDLLAESKVIIPSIQNIYRIISELDIFYSFASTAIDCGWVVPEVDDGFEISIQNARHPVVEYVLSKEGKLFVTNSYYTDESSSLQIVTGPNMGGKSTYLRQIALIVLLAQIGSCVPAEKAKIGIVDRIFTRIGSADNLSMGESTFMTEMLETANILNNASKRSLIILDEVGRGTSTFDGMSIAWAICEFLATKKVKTLFATHYHELTALSDKFGNIKNLTMKVVEYNGEIVFMHQVIEGRADKSYGIHVAKLAGVPESVINTAQKILKILEKERNKLQPRPHDIFDEGRERATGYDAPKLVNLVDKIRSINVQNMTPIEALTFLHSLKNSIDQ